MGEGNKEINDQSIPNQRRILEGGGSGPFKIEAGEAEEPPVQVKIYTHKTLVPEQTKEGGKLKKTSALRRKHHRQGSSKELR